MTIATIMTGIKALAPTFDSDITLTCFGYNAIPDTLNEAEMPCRLLFAPGDDVGAETDFIAMGTAANKMTWSILDRAFLFPVNLDFGIEAYNHKYFDYVESYAQAVNAARCLGTSNAQVTGVSFSRLHPRAYPDGAQSANWCIDVLLTVEEFI